jgi:type I restriction enzyme S subunit
MFVYPLPPLAEQKRIVAKIDELMALCDKLEARRQKKQELQRKLNSSALDKILGAENQEEFEQNWKRICENFDLLYDNPENVEKLKQAILQLAVQGKLVEHNQEDEPASVLIEKTEVKKKNLVKEKKIKQIKGLPIKNEDLPFELPDEWEFMRMGNIAEKLGAGSTPLGGSSVYQESGIKFLRSQNVWNNGLKLENVAYISSEIHKKMNGTLVEPGDILLNITGASIGRSSLVPDNFDEGNVSQHVSIVRLVDKTIREYLHLCIISPYIQSLIMSEQVGISREGLSMNRLKEFLIPIPPLEEQKRIVEKVEQLMGLCDELEAKLRKAREDSEKLMETVVKGLLEGAAA